jgi:hypothetical protein
MERAAHRALPCRRWLRLGSRGWPTSVQAVAAIRVLNSNWHWLAMPTGLDFMCLTLLTNEACCDWSWKEHCQCASWVTCSAVVHSYRAEQSVIEPQRPCPVSKLSMGPKNKTEVCIGTGHTVSQSMALGCRGAALIAQVRIAVATCCFASHVLQVHSSKASKPLNPPVATERCQGHNHSGTLLQPCMLALPSWTTSSLPDCGGSRNQQQRHSLVLLVQDVHDALVAAVAVALVG